MNSTRTAANGPNREGASRNLAYYRERLGFQLDFQGPDDDPSYAGVQIRNK